MADEEKEGGAGALYPEALRPGARWVKKKQASIQLHSTYRLLYFLAKGGGQARMAEVLKMLIHGEREAQLVLRILWTLVGTV